MAAKRAPLRAALALLLLLAGAAVPGAQAECTSIILGSGATVDGSVLIARVRRGWLLFCFGTCYAPAGPGLRCITLGTSQPAVTAVGRAVGPVGLRSVDLCRCAE